MKGEINMKTALTIAGRSSGEGAATQADIKTMTMNGVFATGAITTLTAQDIVVDPVMVTASGARLMQADVVSTLTTAPLPMAEVMK